MDIVKNMYVFSIGIWMELPWNRILSIFTDTRELKLLIFCSFLVEGHREYVTLNSTETNSLDFKALYKNLTI